MTAESGFRAADLVCVRGERRIFEGLSFDLAPGGALILEGPNGSGKSSLLRLCAGLLKPAEGQFWRDGQPVQDDPESHRTSLHYAGHQNALKAALTVAENLAFWASLYDTGAKDLEARLAAALEAFDLGPLAALPARYLSSGQQHRTALARLIAVPQALWLLDEPAVGLDAASVRALTGLISSHRAAGGMVMISTHTDLGLAGSDVLKLADFQPRYRFEDEALA